MVEVTDDMRNLEQKKGFEIHLESSGKCGHDRNG